jgi:hypothetical protein
MRKLGAKLGVASELSGNGKRERRQRYRCGGCCYYVGGGEQVSVGNRRGRGEVGVRVVQVAGWLTLTHGACWHAWRPRSERGLPTPSVVGTRVEGMWGAEASRLVGWGREWSARPSWAPSSFLFFWIYFSNFIFNWVFENFINIFRGWIKNKSCSKQNCLQLCYKVQLKNPNRFLNYNLKLVLGFE